MSEFLSVNFTNAVVPIKPINDQLTLCKCYVLALGKNANKSNITKDAADDALETLYNIPVVGHLTVDDNGEYHMGGHDVELEQDSDGRYRFKSLTVPLGTVPQQDNIHYEEVTEESGEVATYVVADVILWTGRYPEIKKAIYDDHTYFAQSMEIMVKDAEHEEGYLRVDKFQYSALCLLGKSDDAAYNVEPCFPSARVDAYEFSATEEWNRLFEEFKTEVAKTYTKSNPDGEGGNEIVEQEIEEEKKVEFSAEEVVEAEPVETEEKVEEFEEVKETEESNETKKFSVDLTYKEKLEKMISALCDYDVWDEEQYVSYRLIDCTDSDAIVARHTCTEEKCEEVMLKVPYSIAEDAVAFDMAAAQTVRAVWLTKEDEEKLAAEKAETQALAEYKAQRIEEDRRKAYSEIIAEFSDLGEVEEYKVVVKDAMTFENAEQLKDRLYMIRGKNMKKPAKKSLDQIKFPAGFSLNDAGKQQTEVDEFMATYSNKK